ncbi:MAG: hypothetical protein ACLSUW_07455 [Akkermansia sp.]
MKSFTGTSSMATAFTRATGNRRQHRRFPHVLFLALASKTPARTEDGVLDKMMDHAQSICPTGMGPMAA